MNKSVRLGLKIFLALILLFVITLVSLPFIIDPNDYKDQITQLAKQHTGRELHIPGDIELSIFPWLGLELGQARLDNAAGFEPAYFARIEGAAVRIQLLPLLRGEVQIGRVTLQGLDLNLQKDKSGRSNWDDLLASAKDSPSPEPAPDTAPTTSESGSPLSALAALSIAGIDIENAHVQWIDRQTGQDYRVENLDLAIGRISLTETIPLELDFNFNSVQPPAGGHLELATRLKLDIEQQLYILTDLDLRPDIHTELVPGGKLKGTITLPELQADMNQQQIQIGSLSTKLAYQLREPALSGELELRTAAVLDLNQQQYSLNNFSLQNTATGSVIPGGELATGLTSPAINLDLANEKLNINELRFNGHNLEIHSRLRVSQLLSEPRYLLSLESNEFNPRTLLKALKLEQALPPMADSTVMQKAKLGARVMGSLNEALIKPVILQLDDSNLQGYVSVNNFSQPAVRYRLVLNEIDVDRYLPPPVEGEAKKSVPPATPATAAAAVVQLPLDMLRQLDIDGLLTVNKLKAANLNLTDIELGTQAQNGLLRLKPLKANLYQGQYSGNIALDVRSDTPKATLDESLTGIQSGPLLKDLIGDDKVKGKGDIRTQLNATLGQGGLDIPTAKRTLNGTLKFVFENGAIKGINLAHYGRVISAKLKGQPAPEDTVQQTDFARLAGSATITNGVLTNRDLDLNMPVAKTRGQGTVNLVKETLDYTLQVKFTSSLEGQGGKTYAQLDRHPLPIHIKGSFSQPTIDVDYTAMLESLAKEELEKQKARLKKEAQEKVEAEKQKAKEKLEQEKRELEEKGKKEIEEKAKDALKKLFKF